MGEAAMPEQAVERIGSGLLKLLHPDGRWTESELLEVVTFASELRQRVHQQLCVLAAGEFKPRLIAPEPRRRERFAPPLTP